MLTHDQKLTLQVQAVNMANAEARRIAPLLLAAIQPFIGKKIFTVNGDVLARVEAALKPCFPTVLNTLRCWRFRSNYSLVYVVCADALGYSTSVRHEVSVYVADVQDGVAVRAYDLRHYSAEYKKESILALIKKYERAKAALDEAREHLGPFSNNVY